MEDTDVSYSHCTGTSIPQAKSDISAPVKSRRKTRPHSSLLATRVLKEPGFKVTEDHPILTGGSVARAFLAFPPPANPVSTLADILKLGNLGTQVSPMPHLVSLFQF